MHSFGSKAQQHTYTFNISFKNFPNVYVSLALFIYPTKSDIFVRLQVFLHAGYNFLPPKELPLHAKND